jgi:hypothetical protein
MAGKGRIFAEKFAREMNKQLEGTVNTISNGFSADVAVDEGWLKETRNWAWTITLSSWEEDRIRQLVQAIIKADAEMTAEEQAEQLTTEPVAAE